MGVSAPLAAYLAMQAAMCRSVTGPPPVKSVPRIARTSIAARTGTPTARQICDLGRGRGGVSGGPWLLRQLALMVDAGACGGGADSMVEEVEEVEELDGGPGGWGAGRASGAVEAADGVEVDPAPFLILGDLGGRDRGVTAQGSLRHPLE